MAKMTKKQKAAAEKIEEGKLYAPKEAFALVKEIAPCSYDETVEGHFRLGIDTRQADQQLRGTVSLPNGSGKTVRVAVFAEGEAARAAEEAGAEIVGSDELIADIQAGNINFDATVATPDQMPKVGRLGKILGTRGDAEPQAGHRYHRRCQGHQRAEGRPRRVSRRPLRHLPRHLGQDQLHA